MRYLQTAIEHNVNSKKVSFLLDSNLPDFIGALSNGQTGRLDKAPALHGCYLRRFDRRGADKIGSVSWLEGGLSSLVLSAVGKK